MIVIDTKSRVPWTPDWLEAQSEPMRFFFRGSTVFEREEMEAELDAMRAGEVYAFQFRSAFESGVDALLADSPDDAAQLKELRSSSAGGETLNALDQQTLDAATEVLAEHWPAYAKLRTRHMRRVSLLPLVAFRRFCTGWERVPDYRDPVKMVDYASGIDRQVTDTALAGIDPLMLRVAGNFAHGLQYGRAHLKNFEAGSSADGAPPTSSSETNGEPG